MVDKYTKQVLDFLGKSSREAKDAEWDRINGLGLPEIGALSFVEDALNEIAKRGGKTQVNFTDDGYCSFYKRKENSNRYSAYHPANL